MRTFIPKEEDIEKKWYVFDAKDQILGRFASEIAHVLRGKNKPYFTPHIDCGDFVVVINAKEIAVTGNKESDKRYYKYSGYKGGLKSRTLAEMREKNPELIIKLAVKRMLPKNKLANKLLKNLKIYNGVEHPHSAQKPENYKIIGKRR